MTDITKFAGSPIEQPCINELHLSFTLMINDYEAKKVEEVLNSLYVSGGGGWQVFTEKIMAIASEIVPKSQLASKRVDFRRRPFVGGMEFDIQIEGFRNRK